MESSIWFDINRAALESFVQHPVTPDTVTYIAKKAQNTIANEFSSQPLPNSHPCMPTLNEFIVHLISSSNLRVTTLMSTLVYLSRLKSKIDTRTSGCRWSAYGAFLVALVLADKALNKRPLAKTHWEVHSKVNNEHYSFGFEWLHIELMEIEAKVLMGNEAGITECDFYGEMDPLLHPIRVAIVKKLTNIWSRDTELEDRRELNLECRESRSNAVDSRQAAVALMSFTRSSEPSAAAENDMLP